MILSYHQAIKTQNQAQKSIRQQPGYGGIKPNQQKLLSYGLWGMCAAGGATRARPKSRSAPELAQRATATHRKPSSMIFPITVVPAQNDILQNTGSILKRAK